MEKALKRGDFVVVEFWDHGNYHDSPDAANLYIAKIAGWVHSYTPDLLRVCTWVFSDDVTDDNNCTAAIARGAIVKIKRHKLK